jgi:GR25 family glycosyltransferase involved in LPS biosynthesis
MKYNIITINDDRAAYKETIRRRVEIEEVHIPAVNGYEVDLAEEMQKRGIKFAPDCNGCFSAGEIGIWLSMFDCWQWSVDNDEELLTFEDDAIPTVNFNMHFKNFMSELPKDYDFLCLWIPGDQQQDYIYNVTFDEWGKPTHHQPDRTTITSQFNFGAMRLARAYNGYGNVATLYSPKGAKFFMDRVREVGIYTPADCFLFSEHHAGRCNGYAPKPHYAKAVSYDWAAETTVHTERIIV